MSFKSAKVRFLLVLLPLFFVSFGIISFVNLHYAGQELLLEANQLSCSVGSEVALRMRLLIRSVELPLKVSAHFMSLSNKNPSEKNLSSLLPLLLGLKQSTPTIQQTFFLLPNGKGIRSDGFLLDRSQRDYFKHVMKNRTSYISSPFMGETTKVVQAMALCPVLDNKGEIKGVFMASIHLDRLLATVIDKEYLKIDELCIIDESGYIVGTSGGDPSDLGRSVFLPPDDPNGFSEPLSPEVVEGLHKAAETKEQMVFPYTGSDDIEHYATITPCSISGHTWTVITLTEKDTILEPVYRLVRTILWLFVVVFACSCVIIIAFSKWLFLPYEKYAELKAEKKQA